ncbi:MAG: NADH-quinone oxidoreductase subunit L [Phycisphaerales bacterium]|nr:MAG: NADH-quinone oxidoreductase subunit L [Phycisphaerales bacterium]
MLEAISPMLTLAAADAGAQEGLRASLLVLVFPLLASIACGLCAVFGVKSKLPAWITVGALAASFVVTLMIWGQAGHNTFIAHGYEWITLAWGDGPGQQLVANLSLYIDSLTLLWMLFVTGLATLIALYASEYMSHDVGPGYCRFFAYFSLFVFSMACLVMGDNLLLLYLGWEGVGLCSYLLIGYFYTKPSAVAAAKKAFIVNRIGDLGLALGIFSVFVTFGTVEFAPLFEMLREGVDGAGAPLAGSWQATWIPVFFMIGAFGKSAQFPLYVWLPDAMEGPTPVSALIHAATMVTAGVYLIARMMPLYLLDGTHFALALVAWGGGITALLAATIGMAQFDIKRIMAYSTVSQLGFMFAGLGVLTSAGAAFHVFTHAFFKATLFLCCGAVMHGFAGQLDLRKLSGVGFMKGWGIVGIAMFIGCLNLAGFPFTAGYFSKDMILAQTFATPGYAMLGWVLLLTAGITAYYTFRVFFRVFVGPKLYEPGDEHHGDDNHSHDHDHAHEDFHPHPPGWAINSVLALLAVLSIAAAATYFINKPDHGWVGSMVHNSTADVTSPHEGTFLGMDPHKAMYYVSAIVGFIGIAIAFMLHYVGRRTSEKANADKLLPAVGPVATWAQGKWYIDELYDAVIRQPLLVLSHVFHIVDKLLVDGLVNLFGRLPTMTARALRPSQNGVLQSYAAGMAAGLVFVLLVVWALL